MYGVPVPIQVPSNAAYPPAQPTNPPQQQQQQQQQPQTQQQSYPPGSYAARSAQAYNNGNTNTSMIGTTGTAIPGNSIPNPAMMNMNATVGTSGNMNMNNGMNNGMMNINGMNQTQNTQSYVKPQPQPQQYVGNGNGSVSGMPANEQPQPPPPPNQMPTSMPPQQPTPAPQPQYQQQPQKPQQQQPYPSMPQQQQQQQQQYNQYQQPQNQQPQIQQPQIQNPNQYQNPHQQNQYQQSSYMRAPVVDLQTTLLNQSIRRMQEATHIMRGAMEANDLSTTLDRATAMLGELGDHKHHHHRHGHSHGHGHANTTHVPSHSHNDTQAVMSPKHYYELHMMALDELPNLEEYFLSLAVPAPPGAIENIPPQSSAPLPMSVPTVSRGQCTMTELYEVVQYCPRSVPRLYLQICAGSALIRSEEATVKTVLNDLKEAVKCVQCPVRGLFLRHYLLQAIKDKLPDEREVSDVVNVNEHVNEHEHEHEHGEGLGMEEQGNNMVPVEEEQEAQQVHNDNHNPALDNLMGDLGVDLNINDNMIDNGNGEDKNEHHHDALENLMGGLGVDVHQNVGGFFDNVPPAPPQEPPPPAPVPAAAAAAVMSLEEEVDDPNSPGTVKDSYQFVLSNFIEMNKLWVRIQHMPGDSKTRETKRKRERERNELRMMVGTNLVRISELEGVTSAIYGTIILPSILDQIVACHDPLAQAYLMDCIIQVFPDEFHIQTLEVVLNVCPKLREKVNIRTILQSVMNRLANYYEDELLLNDEEDTEGVKMSVMMDSFSMFDECIKSVLSARGVKLTAREAIRLESSLLDFTLKCYPGQMDHIDQCLGICASTLRGEGNHGITNGIVNVNPNPIPLDNRAIDELEKLLSLPLEELALGLLELHHYSELLSLLPWDNRKNVAVSLLKVLDSSGETISSLNEMNQLFAIITPLLRNNPITGAGINVPPADLALVPKVFHIIYNEDTDVHFEMLSSLKRQISECGGTSTNLVPLFYATLKLLNRVRDVEFPPPFVPEEETEAELSAEDNEEEDEHVAEAVTDAVQEDALDTEVVQATAAETDAVEAEIVESAQITDAVDKAILEGEVSKSEDDLSYEEDKEDDGISYDGGDDTKPNEEEDKANDSVDEITAELNDLISTRQEEKVEEKEKSNPPSEALISYSVQNDLFADTPLVAGDEIIEIPVVQPVALKANCRQVFLLIQNIISGLKMYSAVDCFKLALQAAASADCCASVAKSRGANVESLSPVAYTFFTEAFLAYEGGITDSKVQLVSISSMVGTLLACKSFSNNDYETLITKVAQYAARLLKKSDQCKMVMLCSHLFFKYEDEYKNPQRVLECLQRSLKLANMCMASTPGNLQLFVDILDTYLYHFEKQNPMIVHNYITGLIALVNEHVNSIGPNPAITDSKRHFVQIVKSIEEKKRDAITSAQYANIVCNMPN